MIPDQLEGNITIMDIHNQTADFKSANLFFVMVNIAYYWRSTKYSDKEY